VKQEKLSQTGSLQQVSENPWQLSANPNKSNNPDRKSPSMGGGPQFGLKDTGGWGKMARDWLKRYGSSIVLPIVALAILAGGIYLYANQSTEETIFLTEDNSASLVDLDQETTLSDQQTQEDITETIPAVKKEAGSIIETAVNGDGITHLARRALEHYLEENSQELTNEHKIYIEDYLKDTTDSRPLEAEEEVSFSEDLIQEAIDASLQLSPEQLKNLEKYSALVDWQD